VVQHMNEVGHVQPGFFGSHAHSQLVAKVAGSGLAHAGNAQVLADHGGQFDVEVVQRHDAVEDARARQETDGIPHVRRVPALAVVGQIENLVDGAGRPVRGIADAFGGYQHDRPALPLRFAKKFVALFVAGQAQRGHGGISEYNNPNCIGNSVC